MKTLTETAMAYAAARGIYERERAKLTEFERMATIHKTITPFGLTLDLTDPELMSAIKTQHEKRIMGAYGAVEAAETRLKAAAKEPVDD